jgi:glycerol uptake facilitator protein
MRKTLFGECVAECVGTFILVLIGLASVASLVVGEAGISFAQMALVWGAAVTLAIYIAGFVSGAHINPAVTIGLAVWGGFAKKKVLPYIAAQMIGGFCGAAVVYALYRKSILLFEQTHHIIRHSAEGQASAGIFSTFSKPYLSLPVAGLVEMTITMLLMLVILAVTDANNGAAPKNGLPAAAIGLTVAVCGIAFGPLTGFAMNPARDLGPRIFLLMAGWGGYGLGPNYYGLLVPIIGPIVGALIAGAIYFKCIIPFFPKKEAI